MARICIVEDDIDVGAYLRQVLEAHGHQVAVHVTPGKFFDWMLKNRPELVMVDMRLPGMDGREIVRILRASPEHKGIRIISMTALEADSKDAVRAFDVGSDEYLTKPIDPELLAARVRSLLGPRGAEPEEQVVKCAGLVLYPERRACTLDGKEVLLTRMEFDLLEYFVRHGDRVLTRGHLLQYVWKGEPSMTTGTVNKHVETLRRKLGPYGKLVETVVRVGYVFRPGREAGWR